MKLEDYSLNLKQLLAKIESVKPNEHIRPDKFITWVEEFNSIVLTFNSDFNRKIHEYIISDKDYSQSKKTIADSAIEAFKRQIITLRENIADTLKQNAEDTHRFHCFKIDHKCPHTITPDRYMFFVGMPFDNIYTDSYEYGIKTMLEGYGIDTKKLFRADETFSTADFMCKICQAMQESQYILINISGQNPNVMFELGLAYGLSKKVFLLKDKASQEITDLKGLEYIEYDHAKDLALKLSKRLSDLGII